LTLIFENQHNNTPKYLIVTYIKIGGYIHQFLQNTERTQRFMSISECYMLLTFTCL